MSETNSFKRNDGRAFDALRDVRIVAGVNQYAEGSAAVSFGNTKLLISASVETEKPKWMKDEKGGWVTAEYGMLPRSTHTRMNRESISGKPSGRTQEIQRLIGRSLRAGVDLTAIEGITIRIDCDVITADGGTRTAAISGGWVALFQSLVWLEKKGMLNSRKALEIVHPVAGVSVGVVKNELLLDLCYEEDSKAGFDLNLVFNDQREIIEIQGTAENQSVSKADLDKLLSLGEKGVKEIFEQQKSAVEKIMKG